MKRVYNFSAGPAVLPEEVLEQAAREMMSYGDSGMSVMEMSHRSAVYEGILNEAIADLRDLMGISDEYEVMFIQGGASTQFAMIPMNLMGKNGKADFINSGQWSKKAIAQAKAYGDVKVIASSEDKTFSYIPSWDSAEFRSDADYFYICSNNTIYGTRFTELPETGNVPLVADMSSCILSEPCDVNRYGLIFAGAQKNIGPAGVTVVIMRKSLITDSKEENSTVLKGTPIMLQYKTHADNNSMYNTPPTYGIYICGLVFKWLKKNGGLTAMAAVNQEKASILYEYLDESKMFHPTVSGADRSLMNVPFVTGDKDLDAKFVKEASAAGFVNLKGHRSVGGMRASIYNAMPTEGVKALVEFMKNFEAHQ
ncbi:MAG: 3-phosphoserine/phosphohydroxythreonine transaminase [Clostridia bacterium]|uniref:Phosphoserine aminotransferase n=1 Tax=Bianquea renquensis TaxID=2763661 RepID=A0A926DX40_9FIRM|nr:3-phosphoserine/phosphohydroxythreonine transaminase [Bianquea renquensis]MBC8545039.1 3-phosphoserine/phosphohydroxythreonine transaminase [Bianquea renquensis]